MLEIASSLFDTTGFVPRVQCGAWTPELMWMHIGSDLFIWLAYVSIPIVLLYFVRRRDLPYPRLFVLFALFILACGFGHFIESLMFNYPLYRFAAVWKVLTAVVSWATVLALIPVVPRVMTSMGAPMRIESGLGDTTLHRLAPPVSYSRAKDYIIAILAAVLALLGRAAIEPLVMNDHFYVLSLLAVVFVSWQCGFGPGIVTLFVSMLGMIYFFLGDKRTLVVEGLSNQLATAVFFFCGVCCAGLGDAQRIARRRAKVALAIALERKSELESEVTLRKEVERALRQSEQYLRSVLDNTPDCIKVLSLDGRLMEMNRPGQCAMEIEDFKTVSGSPWASLWDGNGQSDAIESVRQAVEGKTSRFQAGCRTAKGTLKHWDVQVAPIPGADGRAIQLVSVSRDITDQQKAAEALRASEEQFRQLADSMPQIVFAARPDGHVDYFNRRWYEYTGFADDGSTGEASWAGVHEPEALDQVRNIWLEAVRTGQLYQIEYKLRRADGEFRWHLGRALPVRNSAGEIIRWFGTNTDIHDAKLAAEATAERARLAALRGDIATILAGGETGTEATLQQSAEILIKHVGAAIARIWTADDAGECLELRASAGQITHANRVHNHIRFGDYKIGRIAASGQAYVTNDMPHDPNLSDPTWAENEKLVAFAGYPLVVEGRVLGVMALFAREKLSESYLAELSPVAETIAQYLEHRRAEKAIRSSELRYRTLTEAIPQIVWNADSSGEISYFNKRWLDYTALPIEQAHGSAWTNVIHPDDRKRVYAEWCATVADSNGSSSDRFSNELRLKNATTNEYRWHLSVAVPLRRADGKIEQWIGSMADIHDQKTVTETMERMVRDRTADLLDEIEERRRAEQQVRAVATELERSNGELEQFAYIASHDLQEPLRKIQAFGDRLRTKFRAELPDAGREYVDRMHESAGRMRRLIDDLLNYSRVSTSTRPFSRVNLNTLVPEVVNDLDERIGPTGGKVIVEELPEIDADPTQMRQLFQNLIANAVKFHRPGVPPIVEIRSELRSEVLPQDDRQPIPACRITVKDNGIGFDEKYLGRIFQVFQRLHGRSEYEGTGVGLAICRKIAERHGGTITAQSRVGEGATFEVTLPIRQPREETSADVQHDKETDHHPDGG